MVSNGPEESAANSDEWSGEETEELFSKDEANTAGRQGRPEGC